MIELFIKLGNEAQTIMQKHDSEGRRAGTTNYFGHTSIGMDIYLENMVKEHLKNSNCHLITEENPEKMPENPAYTAILDPLDGSKNYERGFPAYAFAIAGTSRSNPTIADIEVALVLDLANGNAYLAVNGDGLYINSKKIVLDARASEPLLIGGDFGGVPVVAGTVFPRVSTHAYMRMLGASTLEMALVACGVLDGYMDVRGSLLVTHSAGIALMAGAGAYLTDKDGKELKTPIGQDTVYTVVAARNKDVHKKMLEMIEK